MRITSTTFEHNGKIPERCAFGIPDAEEHINLGENMNPQLSWSNIPPAAKSLVLLCIDPDAPSSMDDFNREDKTISADLLRMNFVHWIMVDIAAREDSIDESECADGIIPGGKPNPPGPPGSRQGINDYTNFMSGDPDMEGDYIGYDGPCPPWNDERLHHYHFMLYAIDLDKTPVDERFSAADVLAAIEGHVIDMAKLIGKYSLNPDVPA